MVSIQSSAASPYGLNVSYIVVKSSPWRSSVSRSLYDPSHRCGSMWLTPSETNRSPSGPMNHHTPSSCSSVTTSSGTISGSLLALYDIVLCRMSTHEKCLVCGGSGIRNRVVTLQTSAATRYRRLVRRGVDYGVKMTFWVSWLSNFLNASWTFSSVSSYSWEMISSARSLPIFSTMNSAISGHS